MNVRHHTHHHYQQRVWPPGSGSIRARSVVLPVGTLASAWHILFRGQYTRKAKQGCGINVQLFLCFGTCDPVKGKKKGARRTGRYNVIGDVHGRKARFAQCRFKQVERELNTPLNRRLNPCFLSEPATYTSSAPFIVQSSSPL